MTRTIYMLPIFSGEFAPVPSLDLCDCIYIYAYSLCGRKECVIHHTNIAAGNYEIAARARTLSGVCGSSAVAAITRNIRRRSESISVASSFAYLMLCVCVCFYVLRPLDNL